MNTAIRNTQRGKKREIKGKRKDDRKKQIKTGTKQRKEGKKTGCKTVSAKIIRIRPERGEREKGKNTQLAKER